MRTPDMLETIVRKTLGMFIIGAIVLLAITAIAGAADRDSADSAMLLASIGILFASYAQLKVSYRQEEMLEQQSEDD